MLMNENWQMLDRNGNTVDSFPPFSTLEEDEPETASSYEIHDDGADSPRVVGNVTGGTQTASEGGSSADGSNTSNSPSNGSENDSTQSGTDSMPIILGIAAVAGIGGAGYYITKKKRDSK